MVREIINYLKENYKEEISIDHICNHVAFSNIIHAVPLKR